MKSIYIISGEKGSGKTTFLIDVLNLLQMNDFVVRGFVALHNLQSDSYQIKNIETNEKFPLMQRVASFDEHLNHFKLFSEGVKLGNDCINNLLVHPPDIAIVDEIGGYELSGKLWSSAFTQLINSSIPLFFTTKTKLLDRVMDKWKITPTHIFQSVDFDDPHKAFELIKRDL